MGVTWGGQAVLAREAERAQAFLQLPVLLHAVPAMPIVLGDINSATAAPYWRCLSPYALYKYRCYCCLLAMPIVQRISTPGTAAPC
eukprot:3568647-Rhodomonas_salina.2